MGNQIKLPSGFTFDYTNLLGEGKVTQAELPDTKAAHKAVCHMRETGEVRGHLSKDGTPELVLFPQLPYVKDGNLNSPADIGKLKKFGESVKGRVDVVVSLGIGGSFLGNKVLFDVGCGEFWNAMTPEERGGWPEVYFSGNNIDPRRTQDLLKYLAHKAEVAKTHRKRSLRVLLLVISKSGGTLDTMSNFMVIYDKLTKTANVETEVVAVTDPNEEKPTLLKKLATEKGWLTFRVPDGVGGRFSVFSDVGLSLAACVGFDIESFLRGARDMDEACKTDELMKNPAMLNAALKFAAAQEHGREIEVMMPYGDYLKSLSEWYIQLLAESLGKEDDRAGKKVYYGRTPLVAVGTTDMHAQTQQHQEGRLNKIVQFIRVADWPEDCLIPDVFPEAKKLSDIAGVTMAEALEVARVSNEEALASNGRYSACFTLPTLNAYHLGELMYMLALSVAYEGEFADVDAFNQPGVEAYKRIMGPRLAEVKQARTKKA
ncbi:MAG: glucose-6-phosphate isomerase [Schwartzia sp.]|nr:glucose-6-phosphate isomerase [Schwartzia sp. (in: firmicutes)]